MGAGERGVEGLSPGNGRSLQSKQHRRSLPDQAHLLSHPNLAVASSEAPPPSMGGCTQSRLPLLALRSKELGTLLAPDCACARVALSDCKLAKATLGEGASWFTCELLFQRASAGKV